MERQAVGDGRDRRTTAGSRPEARRKQAGAVVSQRRFSSNSEATTTGEGVAWRRFGATLQATYGQVVRLQPSGPYGGHCGANRLAGLHTIWRCSPVVGRYVTGGLT